MSDKRTLCHGDRCPIKETGLMWAPEGGKIEDYLEVKK